MMPPETLPNSSGGPTPTHEPLLLEVAWEACNQLGGIYTVLRSKVPSMITRWGDRYCLVGPYNESTAAVEFEPTPLDGPIGRAVEQLDQKAVVAHAGRWLVTGRPQVVLLDYRQVFGQLDQIKYKLWEDHGIPTPGEDELIGGVVAFGEVCRRFLNQLASLGAGSPPLIAHFHEWMGSAAVPTLRRDGWPGAIVFTTHATVLGRYLSTNNPQFYDHLPFLDPDKEAAEFNVESQHQLERAAAHGAHVFTTVSDVAAEECSCLLGRRPDLLLPNGLNIQRFAAIHEFQNLHRIYKEKIHQFTISHFFPSYSFNLDKTLYLFTSGRYEYRNKGMDLTIEALARLNHLLQEEDVPVTVVAFIVTKAQVRSISVQALHSSAVLSEIRSATDAITRQIGEQLFATAATGRFPDLNTLVDDYWRLRLRRTIQAWRRDLPPSIITHDLADESNDPVLSQLRDCRLWNLPRDKVKVVYHPQFITPTNPLFGMDYDQFVRGCHLGVFPSFYEPWGYTPLEAMALGVPAVTSDLSGFGSYLKQLLPDHEERGLYVVQRHGRSLDQVAAQLADRLLQFCRLSRRERIALRNNVESFSEHFDWHNLGHCYREAHCLALDRIEGTPTAALP